MIQFDEIGTLYDQPVLDANGNITEQPLELDGWHVNTTHPVTGWDAYRATPTAPRRVFGGVDTIFYTFASKRTFQLALKSADLSLPEIVRVPASVTMRQARLALLKLGKLSLVEAAINSLPEPQKSAACIEWDFSNDVQRHNGLVSMMAPSLGLDDAALDALFIQADAL